MEQLLSSNSGDSKNKEAINNIVETAQYFLTTIIHRKACEEFNMNNDANERVTELEQLVQEKVTLNNGSTNPYRKRSWMISRWSLRSLRWS